MPPKTDDPLNTFSMVPAPRWPGLSGPKTFRCPGESKIPAKIVFLNTFYRKRINGTLNSGAPGGAKSPSHVTCGALLPFKNINPNTHTMCLHELRRHGGGKNENQPKDN